MFDVQIADIDLTMPLADFEKDFQDEISNWGASMNYTVTPMSTKRGKNMYKLVAVLLKAKNAICHILAL